ncbi:MAG: DUF4215 domain-containing protein [bacterium]
MSDLLRSLLVVGAAVLLTGCVYDWPTDRIEPQECGNGVLDLGEECDGEELDGQTCASRGFVTGTLSCSASCAFDTASCSGAPVCGDGVLSGEEVCDDGNADDNDGCDHTCDVEPGWACEGEPSDCESGCGNGVCYLAGGESAAACPEDCGWAQLSAGAAHTCGVKRDGTVWCWGANEAGQLGDGALEGRLEPSLVPDLEDVVEVAAGEAHTCAVDSDGRGWCWGSNDQGQLGDGSIIDRSIPVRVLGLSGAASVSAGGRHTCAVTTELEAYCWGANADGQLGDGAQTGRQAATRVVVGAGLTSARAVSAGSAHTCAIREDDTLWCWGSNTAGQLGTGDGAPSLLPLAVLEGEGFLSAAVVATGAEHTCAVDATGAVWCWGDGGDRRLGDGAMFDRLSPVLVINFDSARAVAAGGEHSCAVTEAGAYWCWGRGTSGQLGTGSTVVRSDPVALAGLPSGASVTTGGLHSCALRVDATAWCWGSNTAGQLGDATTTLSSTPVAVSEPY